VAEYEPLLKAHQEAMAAYEEAKKQGKAPAKAPQAPEKPVEPRQPENSGLARVDYPLKLTKVIVAMPPHILYVNAEVPVAKPVIFLDKLGVLQAPDGM
jgi:hypothetical protein